MDRGNRTTVVASSLLALTLLASAVLVLSDKPTFAQMPEGQKPVAPEKTGEFESNLVSNSAVSQADFASGSDLASEQAMIQQVAGGQTSNSSNSGGLLKSLVGSGKTTTGSNATRRTTATKPASKSEGLFSDLFGGRSTSSSQVSESGSPKKEYRVVTPLPNDNREPANWDGVPFHQAKSSNGTTNNTTNIAPIRDPGSKQQYAMQDTTSPRAVTTRVPLSRAIPVPSSDSLSTSSARRSVPSATTNTDNRPAVVTRPVAPLASSISSPSRTTTSTRVSTLVDRSTLSDNTSSRRSDRRSVDPLDAGEVVAESKPIEPVRERVMAPIEPPKVARRELPSSTPPAAVAKSVIPNAVPSKAIATVKAKPKTIDSIAQEAVAQEVPKKTTPSETASTGTVTSTLAVPRIAASATPSLAQTKPQTTTGRYTTPTTPGEIVADSGEEEPLGSVPTTPYAASSPDPRAMPSESMPSEFQTRGSVVSSRSTSDAGSEVYHPASSMPSTDFGPRVTAPLNIAAATSPSLSADTSNAIDSTISSDNRMAQAPAALDQPRTLMPLHSSTNAIPVMTTPSPLTPTASTPPSLQLDKTPLAASPAIQSPLTTTPTPTVTAPSMTAQAVAAAPTASTEDATRDLQPNQSTVASELPGIRVATFGPNQIMIRQSNPYEIRIENRGSIDASGVIVRANIPSWAEVQGSSASRGDVEATAQSGQVERLVWKIDSLPAGATERMFVRLKAVRSGSHDMDVDWTLAPQKSVATVYVQEPKIAVSIDGPDEVTYGESKTYKVRISNPGDGVAPNVMFTLSPNSATPQTQRIGDIPAGKEASIDIELTAQDLGDLNINGLASGDLELRAEATKTIRVAAAKLQATLSGPQIKYQNTESIYRLEIKNAGTAASEQVVASLRLPVGVKYLGGIEPASLRADMLTWKIDALQPGAVRDYQFKCNMNATGDQMFSFECRGTAAGQAEVAIATRVEAIADLVLTVNDPPAPAPVGSDVTYEIVVRNRGSKEATEVSAIAQFSDGIEPQRVEGQTGQIVTGQVIFDTIGRIAPGEERVIRIIAKAETDGHHRFRTEVRSGDTMLVAEEATHYMSPQSDRVSRRSDEKPAR